MASDERTAELHWQSATTLAQQIKRKKVSPVEVVDAILARIDKLNPTLNAYVTLTAETARREARAAERALTKRGARLGPLHGVPFSVKDLVITKGVRTTFGTPLYRDNVPNEDAPIVARLKAAGGIMLGKTNTPTMGWIGATHNLLFGPTRNPWNLERTPGGSSGGASAACAAGLGPLHVGTDGGGSIRIPASFAGIFGHKASYGRVPTYPVSGAWSLSHAGPMTRTVADAALMLNVCAGPDERDQYSLPAERVDFVTALRGSLAGWRVAWTDDLGFADCVDPEVSAVCVAGGGVVRDLLRRHRDAAGALPGPAQRDRRRPGAHHRGRAAPSAVEVRAGVARSPGLVAASARVLREVRSAADADHRLSAIQARSRQSARDRRSRGRPLRMDSVHLPLQPHRPAGGVGAGRLHRRRVAGRIADRRAPLRRHERAARRRRLRAPPAVGRAPPAPRLRRAGPVCSRRLLEERGRASLKSVPAGAARGVAISTSPAWVIGIAVASPPGNSNPEEGSAWDG